MGITILCDRAPAVISTTSMTPHDDGDLSIVHASLIGVSSLLTICLAIGVMLYLRVAERRQRAADTGRRLLGHMTYRSLLNRCRRHRGQWMPPPPPTNNDDDNNATLPRQSDNEIWMTEMQSMSAQFQERNQSNEPRRRSSSPTIGQMIEMQTISDKFQEG